MKVEYENMRLLDIDMDYFLKEIPIMIFENNMDRVSDDCYPVWNQKEVTDFFEKRLGLSKKAKIKGKIIKNHNEALYYWRQLILENKLTVPFEVIHIDSHADLGLGYPSWTFILDSILRMPVNDRYKIESYKDIFEQYFEPGIGDYLLFAVSYRWIKKLVYVCNPVGLGDDYLWMILKDGIEPNDRIQLAHNNDIRAIDIAMNQQEYYATAIHEPEVEFDIIRNIENINYDGKFDYLTFCISPNYTPASADFIIELIKDYIEEEQ